MTQNNQVTSRFCEVNTTDGSIIETTVFPSNEAIHISNPLFDEDFNKIYSFNNTRIYSCNATNFSNQTSFETVTNNPYPLHEINILNNRLFAKKSTNTSGLNYTISLFELDINNGSLIDTRLFDITFSSYSGYGSAVSKQTNELFMLTANVIIKYNIITEQSDIFILPSDGMNATYPGILFAENRLFVRKKSFSNGQVTNSILEINKENGSILNTNNLTSDFNDFYANNTLSFLPNTHEIVGLYSGLFQNSNENKILKYNINTSQETLLSLPTEIETSNSKEEYRQLFTTSNNLNVSEDYFYEKNKKIKNVYNLLGQKVSLQTYNQILIIEYENGSKSKKIVVK